MFLFHSSGRQWAALTLLAAAGSATGLLSGCAPARPTPETAVPPIAGLAARAPDRLLAGPSPAADSLLPAGEFLVTAGRRLKPLPPAARLPRKCKGCSFYYGPTTVATAAKKATVAAAPRATATSTGRRSGPAVIAASASPLHTQHGRQGMASVPAARAPAGWGGAPRSVGRAVLLSSILTLVAAGLSWLLLVGQRRRRAR